MIEIDKEGLMIQYELFYLKIINSFTGYESDEEIFEYDISTYDDDDQEYKIFKNWDVEKIEPFGVDEFIDALN